MNASNITLNTTLPSKYCKYYKLDSDLEKKAKEIALVFLYVSGISSNIFIIVLAVRYTLRRNLHYLITNIAVSDALFLAIRMWRHLFEKYNIKQLYPDGVSGDILCTIETFVTEMSYRVSLVTLLVINIERFRVIRQTHKIRPYTLKQRIAVLGICWLLPMITSGFLSYGWYFDNANKTCSFHKRFKMMYTNIALITACSATIIILVLSIITIRRLSYRQAIEAYLNPHQRNMRRRHTKSAVRTILASVVLYDCCWFPLHVLWSLDATNIISLSDCMNWVSLFYMCDFLPALNSCLSPFIYITFLNDFREATKLVLCCFKKATNKPLQEKKHHYQQHQ